MSYCKVMTDRDTGLSRYVRVQLAENDVFRQTAVSSGLKWVLKTRRSSARCLHRGFAFVTFATKDAGAQAISYWDKQEFMGRTMQVRQYLGPSITWMGGRRLKSVAHVQVNYAKPKGSDPRRGPPPGTSISAAACP